jgi:hypothetical protein
MNVSPSIPFEIHATMLLSLLQHLDPHGEGTVKYLDFLPIVAKRLQLKETLEQLLVSAPGF